MHLKDIYTKIQQQLDKQLPFVVYRKGNSKELQTFLQEDNKFYGIKDYSDSGFVFAPFDSSSQAVLIPKANSIQYNVVISEDKEIHDNYNFKEQESFENFNTKQEHIQLVEDAIDTIKSGTLQKVVVSRKEKVNFAHKDTLDIFQELIANYPKAFVYCWYHPKVGTWLGATPETLLHISGNQFFTMALAGTQPYQIKDAVDWADKELEEQNMVTQFILKGLSPISDNIVSSKTYTHRAGTLLHLRTDIKGNINVKESGIDNIIKILHPTPAVCGLPKKGAKDFILKQEGYERKFYTGFLGELNINVEGKKVSNLFVNLRCMQLEKEKAIIYVGGGITKDSNPEKEWEETVRKTETMKKVLL